MHYFGYCYWLIFHKILFWDETRIEWSISIHFVVSADHRQLQMNSNINIIKNFTNFFYCINVLNFPSFQAVNEETVVLLCCYCTSYEFFSLYHRHYDLYNFIFSIFKIYVSICRYLLEHSVMTCWTCRTK